MLASAPMSKQYDSLAQMTAIASLKNIELTASYLKASQLLEGVPTFTDIGCATGLNTTNYWKKLLEISPPSVPFSLVFSDLPSNDWNSVMKNSLALSELGSLPRFYFSITGGSFVNELVKPGSVNFITSYMTIHWLTTIKHASDSLNVWYSDEPEVAEFNRRQAKSDLTACLKARANELKPGGFFNFTALSNSTKFAADKESRVFIDLLNENRITPEEFKNLQFACSIRTKADYEEVFSELSDLFEVKEFFEFRPSENCDHLTPDVASLQFKAINEARFTEELNKSRSEQELQEILSFIFESLMVSFGQSMVDHTEFYVVLKRR